MGINRAKFIFIEISVDKVFSCFAVSTSQKTEASKFNKVFAYNGGKY